jgi:hypothetical protein
MVEARYGKQATPSDVDRLDALVMIAALEALGVTMLAKIDPPAMQEKTEAIGP